MITVSLDPAQSFLSNINLVAKMRLGGRCLVRESPSGAEGPGR